MLAQSLYLGNGPVRPIFVLGCGRSGTTILGQILSRHAHVLYLNEPRHLWLKAYEQTDIWSDQAKRRQGRLDLSPDLCNWQQNRRIQRMFGLSLSLYNKSILVDKLPEYAFRIPFLLKIFPEARFVHVIRHGSDVARSIEQRHLRSAWYGPEDYKWQELRRLAKSFSWGAETIAMCRTGYARGLLEWRLSLEFAFKDLARLPPERSLEVRYEKLLENPSEVCHDLEKFLEYPDGEMERYATEVLKRESRRPQSTLLSPEDRKIGGLWFTTLGYANG